MRTIYQRPNTRSGDAGTARPNSRPITGRDVDGRQSPKLGTRTTVGRTPAGVVTSRPRAVGKPVAGHRYNPAVPNLTPRAANPVLQPRPAPGGRVTTAPGVGAPRLNPRPAANITGRSSYGSYGSYGYGGYYGRSLFFSNSAFDACWWAGSQICWGVGSGYFGLSYCAPTYWSSRWPSIYYRSSYYQCAWNWWRTPYYTSNWWWWPSYCYLPSYLYYAPYGGSVVVAERDAYPTEEVEVAGSATGSSVVAESTPETLAQRYVALGDYYFQQERFSDAADAYARARTYAPDDASLHFVLADATFATGDYHFAAFLIGEGLRLDPEMARSEADKRLFYGKVETFERHQATLRRYLEDKPYDAMAWLVLGYNLKFSGKPEEARKAFARVLEIDPDNRSAQLFAAALEPREEKAAEKASGKG